VRWRAARSVLALGAAAAQRCQEVNSRIELIHINDRVLAAAGAMLSFEVRSLDALHLATATLCGPELKQLVTYDIRMAAACRTQGITVVTPK
jgi:uncharacterized protein